MCGIVGYIGIREAYPILISGLHRLEYRGYDSAGVALLCDSQQQISVYKAKGKVSALEEAFPISLQIFYSTENQRGFKKRGDSPTTIPQQFQLL